MQNLDKHLAYKYGSTTYLTFAGVENFAQISKHKEALKNKEELLKILHIGYTTLCSSMTVNTSKPYSGQKKACTDGAVVPFVIEDEERQVVVIRKQRTEIELLLPIIRVKNEEEIQHIQNIKTAQAEQLQFQFEMQQKINAEQRMVNAEQRLINAEEIEKRQKLNTEEIEKQQKLNAEEIEKQQKLNAEALLYKDATQDRDRIERESLLQYKRAELELEKERRMMMDPDYKVVPGSIPVAMQPMPVNQAVIVYPPIAGDIDAAIKLRTEQDAVKKANSERALKGAATRRQNRDSRNKERIELELARDRANHAARIARMDAEALKNQTPHQRNNGMPFLDVWC